MLQRHANYMWEIKRRSKQTHLIASTSHVNILLLAANIQKEEKKRKNLTSIDPRVKLGILFSVLVDVL